MRNEGLLSNIGAISPKIAKCEKQEKKKTVLVVRHSDFPHEVVSNARDDPLLLFVEDTS